MLPHRTTPLCHVFMLVLCLSAAEDFDWTKNDRGSFYYGTFPVGRHTPRTPVSPPQNILTESLTSMAVLCVKVKR